MRTALLATLALLTPLAAAPQASAHGPACDALYIALAVPLVGLVVVDGLAMNAFGPMADGTYPGRSVVQTAFFLWEMFLPDGAVGAPLHEACSVVEA